MAVATLTSTRALRRPRRADPRAIVGIVITFVALAGSVAFWVSATDSRPVLVATRDLPAGATLSSADLGVAYMRVDDAVYRAAIPADSLQSLVGRELGEPIHAQQVLAQAQIANQLALGRDQVAITIPARPDSAVDGRLRPGDGVQILVTLSDKSRGTAQTSQVLERAQVYEVGRDAPLASSSATTSDTTAPRGAISSVTLAVTADEARQLAEARRTGDLDIVLLPPAEPSRQ